MTVRVVDPPPVGGSTVAGRQPRREGPDEAALRALLRDGGTDQQRRVGAQVALAVRWRDAGRYREAGLLFRFTLATATRVFGPATPVVAAICNEWGVCARYAGQFDLAGELYLDALAIFEATGGPRCEAVAAVCHNLSGLAHARGRPAAGEWFARRAGDIFTDLFGADHPRVAADRAAWAALLIDCGQLDHAERVLREALATLRAHCGPEHSEVAAVLNNLAAIDARRGHRVRAEAKFRQALLITERALGPDHPDCAPILINLGRLHDAAGRHHAARRQYARAAALLDGKVAPDHPHLRACAAGPPPAPGRTSRRS